MLGTSSGPQFAVLHPAPRREKSSAAAELEVAPWLRPLRPIGVDHADLGLLSRCRWKVRDSYACAGDPHSYREFIQNSRCEFSVAKTGYVETWSGWISDRTACYLASGKPAIVQSTGFEPRLPTGRGLLTFRTLEEAAARVAEVDAAYLAHCEAARRIAEEHFDSDKVLSSVLEIAGID